MSHKTENLRERFYKEHFGKTLSSEVAKPQIDHSESEGLLETRVINFGAGDRVKRSKAIRDFAGDEFTGGKTVETITKVEPHRNASETKLWLSNGLWVNPLMVEKVSPKDL